MLLRIGFYQLGELATFGLPLAERTLQNKIRGGAIRLGDGQPDLPIRHVGGRIVVASEDLRQWLVAMGGLPGDAEPATAATPAPAARRGRPRKTLQQGGA